MLDKEYSYIEMKKMRDEELIYCYYWEDGIRKYEVYQNHYYYLFVEKEELEMARKKHYRIEEDKKYISIDGKEVFKVSPLGHLSREEYKAFRNEFKKTYEGDILGLTRWICVEKPKFTKEIRTFFIDIETIKTEDGYYSVPEEAIAPVVCIGIYDSFSNTYISLINKKGLKTREEIKEKHIIKYFNDEKEMFEEFIRIVGDYNPDYFSGWNIESFDIPYILNRMKNLNMKPETLSSLNYYKAEKKGNVDNAKYNSFYINISGRGIFDLMLAAKRLWLGKNCGYSLEKMSNNYLNDGKLKVDIEKIYREDIEKLIEYNRKDLELTMRLNDKLELIKIFQKVQDIVSINLDNTMISSKVIYSFIIQKTDRILKTSEERTTKIFKGADVYCRESPGILKNCYKFDVQSMYPSIVRTFNISCDTVLEKFEPGCINIDNKFFFKKDIIGIVPQITETLFKERMISKEKKDLKMDLNLKILLNSIYGIFAFKYSKMFSGTCAEAITYMGRKLLNLHIDKIKELFGYEIVIADTDGFISYNRGEEIDFQKVLDLSEKLILDLCNEVGCKSNIVLKYEGKVDKLVIFGVKKKYICLTKDKMVGTGMDYMKSDTLPIAADLQKEVCNEILNNESFSSEILTKIKNKYLGLIDNAIRKKENLEYISIPAKIGKKIKDYKTNVMIVRALKNSKLNVSTGESFFVLFCNEDVIAYKTETDIDKSSITFFDKDRNKIIERIFKKIEFLDGIFRKDRSLEEWGINKTNFVGVTIK